MNSTNTEKEPRQFYLIGHGCNNIRTINKALNQGVNGIECDLWADKNKKWWISHGGICRTDLINWLTYIEKAEQKFGRQLSIIVFDIKTPISIKGVREIINTHLPAGLHRVYSTANIHKARIFKEIVPLLNPNEVIAIDEEDDPEEVAAFFKKIGATQCWYGNGITPIPFDDQYHDSMQQASALIRNSSTPFTKFYTWSIHRKKSLYKYIVEDKVDAMIVGLDSFYIRPVSNALKIIRACKEIQLADRNSKLF